MKISALVLCASLAANAALFAAFAFKSSSVPGTAARTTFAARADASGLTTTKNSESAAEADTASSDNLPAATWSTLQNSDLATLVARLRAAGFPPNVIRRVVADQLALEYTKRYSDLLKQLFDRPFWKDSSGGSFDPKILSAFRAATKEYTDQLKSLVGEDPAADNSASTSQKQRYGDLPKAKIEQLQAIEADYNELTMQVRNDAHGLMLPEDNAKLALLDKEKLADFAKVLTPQELEEYNLRSSTTASQMRSTLATFNPTEAEFRALFKFQSALDEQYPRPMGSYTPEQMAPRQEIGRAHV
jgi:hypothetical protein